MYIGLKQIQNQLTDYPTLLTSSDGIHALTGWSKLQDAPQPLTIHLLYTCVYTPELLSYPFIPDMHLLCIVPDNINMDMLNRRFPDFVSILFVQCNHPEELYALLQNYYNIQCGAGYYGATLLDFLAFDDGLQPAIDYSYRVFGNPVFVFDSNYNLIAAPFEKLKGQNFTDRTLEKKGFTDQDFKMVSRQNNIHERVKRSEIPLRAFNSELGYEQLYCSINTSKDLGHIVVSAINKPFEPIDTEFLLTLKKYINEQIKKDAFIQNARGFNYEYFIRDLLDHKVAADRASITRMNYVKDDFKGNNYCIVIEIARSQETINARHVRNMLESRIPYLKTIIYNGQLIAIITISNKQLLPPEYLNAMQKLCQENGLYAGMSNCFQNILKIEEYYNQALRAIELGICKDNSPNLFAYENYYLEHMMNAFTLNESSWSCALNIRTRDSERIVPRNVESQHELTSFVSIIVHINRVDKRVDDTPLILNIFYITPLERFEPIYDSLLRQEGLFHFLPGNLPFEVSAFFFQLLKTFLRCWCDNALLYCGHEVLDSLIGLLQSFL